MTRALNANLLARAALTSIAVVVLLAPAAVIVGGFAPTLPEIGRLGAVLNEGVVWVWLGVLCAGALSSLALALGGGRFTVALLGLCMLTAAGAGVVIWRFASFAADQGVAFNLLRTASAPPATRVADERIVYATFDGQPLSADLWRPRTAEPGSVVGGSAVVVYVHGGSFVAGTIGMRPHLFGALADAGIAVVDVQYRLAPPPRWREAPADVLCALVWLRSIARTEGIDPDRVVVMGESAGGSLALVAAYAAGTDRLASSCGGEPIVPAGVIAVAPAADLAGIWQDQTLIVADQPFPEAYVGGTPAEYPERYAAASPFGLMRADLPPTLLLAGENDHLVRLPRVRSIADALATAGAEHRLLVVPFGEHGFDGVPNSFGAQMEEAIVRAFVAEIATP